MILEKAEKFNLETIIAYRQGKPGVALSEFQKELDDKLDYADNIIREYRTQKRCIPMLLKKFPTISRTTAWRLYMAAKYVHGSLNKYDKDYERIALYEKYMDLVDKMWAVNPVKYAKNIVLALDKAAKVMGLDQPELEKINPEDLVQHNYILMMKLKDETAALLDLKTAFKLPDEQKKRIESELLEQSNFIDFEELE